MLTQDGWTALIWAARNNRPNIARLLIRNGANLDLQNDVCHGWNKLSMLHALQSFSSANK